MLELRAAEAHEWSYRGEGAANIVLAYNGSNPFFLGKVLRLQKTSDSKRSSCMDVSTSEPEHPVLSKVEQILWADWPSVATATTVESLTQAYARHVMCPILGDELVDPGILVLVSSEFLEFVAHNIHDARPSWRADISRVNIWGSTALLISDHSVFHPLAGIKGDVLSSFSVEIKPKCGFLPSSPYIAAENSIKRKVSRFAMHQVLKFSQGQIKSVSNYSPLDLFSGSFEQIYKSIHDLFENPQNNLRVFVDGKACHTSLLNADIEVPKWAPVDEALKSCMSCSKGGRLKALKGLVSELLFGTDALKNLLAAQKLDTYDIEGVIHAYNKIAEQHSDVFPDCTNMGNMNDADESSDHSQLIDFDKNIKDFDLAESRKVVRDYLIAATAKDCSLMLTFQEVPDNETVEVDTECHKMIHCSETGKCYRCKMHFLDLDLKPLKKMPHYYRLDQDIVRAYLNASQNN